MDKAVLDDCRRTVESQDVFLKMMWMRMTEMMMMMTVWDQLSVWD